MIQSVGEHSIQHRSSTVRYCGADGKANVGISNDNAGENPARRKIKDSPAMSIIRGKSDPKGKPSGDPDGKQVNIPVLIITAMQRRRGDTAAY